MALTELLRGLIGPQAGLPEWEQWRGRTILPTFLGRVAIWQLCKLWQLEAGDEILMPAYNCGTEVDPFVVHGCKVVLYRVDEKARIDLEDILRRRTRRTRIVYVTHYFGWPQNLRELVPWCRTEGIRLVEDCALALFSSGTDGRPLGMQGDAAIFSLGKFLPVPAGGLLTVPAGRDGEMPLLQDWPRKETFKRTGHLLRKDLQRRLEALGLYSLSRRAKMRISKPQADDRVADEAPDMPSEYYLDEQFKNGTMPPLARRTLRAIDPGFVRKRRRENYLALQRELAGRTDKTPLFDQLPDGTCPLAFPVVTHQRHELVRALEAYGVCSYPFWEGYHRGLSWREFPEARFLKENVLTLPVNQSLSEAHMAFIVDLLRVLLAKGDDHVLTAEPHEARL
jgi:hypothetical protein